MSGKVYYIAGPMSGLPDYNRPAFHAMAKQLEEQGHHVLNPATLPDGLTQGQYMDICFAMLRGAEAVMFLSGWQASKGAVAEFTYASKLSLVLEKEEESLLEKAS